MADQKKIADEIKSKGFAIAKGDMNDELPDEWFVFGIWFFLKQDFCFDLDWEIGKYYFYVEPASDVVKAKEPKMKSLDSFSAVEFLKDGLLKNFDKFNDIAHKIISDGFCVSDDIELIELLEDRENRALLWWITDELGEDAINGFVNHNDHLVILTTYSSEQKVIDYAQSKGYKTEKERPEWADEEDDTEELKIIGFDNLDFFF